MTIFYFKKTRAISKKLKVSGFTLIETIVATAILSVAIISTMSLAGKGLASARYAKDQVTAYYLAEEAVDYVRNIRDDNLIANQGGSVNWLQGLASCSATFCAVDVYYNTVAPCGAANNFCQLSFYKGVPTDNLYGIYAYPNGNANPWVISPYQRTVLITEMVPGQEAKVFVIVSWMSGLIQKSFTLSEFIYNWLPVGR